MAQEEIITLFTSTHAKNNFSKLDATFISSFYGFLKKIGCTEIELNSTFRPGKSNGSHGWGRAVDINQMTVNGKKIAFNFKFKYYDDKLDEWFYNECVKEFGNTLYNYYSPALVRHVTSTKAINNTFRFAKNRLEAVLNAEKIPAAKRNWNESHLNHCHIALDLDGKMKKDKVFASNSTKKTTNGWKFLVPPSHLAGEESIYRWGNVR